MTMSKDEFKKLVDGAVRAATGESVDDLLATVTKCRACGQKNRVKFTGKAPRCGKCGLSL